MTIDEIKMILGVLKGVSEGAATVAWAWIAASYFVTLVGYLCFAGTVLGVVTILTRAVSKTNEWVEAGRRVARAYGGKGNDYLCTSDRAAIDMAIDNAK